MVARSTTGRAPKKRVEARTTEIDTTELNKLINHDPATPSAVTEPDAEVELVYSETPAAARVAPPRLVQTLRGGVMTPVGGVHKIARPTMPEGSGGLPPAEAVVKVQALADPMVPLPELPIVEQPRLPQALIVESIEQPLPEAVIVDEEPSERITKRSDARMMLLLVVLILVASGAIYLKLDL